MKLQRRYSIVFVFALAAALLSALTYADKLTQKGTDFNQVYSRMDRSPAGLDAYKESMLSYHLAAKEKKLKSVYSTVTLSEPISIENAVELIEHYKIKPNLVYAFAHTRGGELITIGGRFRKGLQVGLKDVLDAEDASLVGVVSLIGGVYTDKLPSLQADSQVFLVDISADEHFADNPGNRDYMPHFAWTLYHQKAFETVQPQSPKK